jgi:acetyl esterase/lipase
MVMPMVNEAEAPAKPSRWLRWLVGIVGGLVVVVVVAVVVFLVVTRNPSPGEFYTPPEEIDAAPGTILRSESFDDGIPTGAEAWRILYISTDEHDEPIAVSGLVIAPEDPAPGPHPVLAWAHGTTGIARPCAPSLTDAPLRGIPDVTGPLAEGWVLTLTDYPGLGTPGPHPYLVGQSEGRAVLDSVRAAHNLDTGIDLADDYAIWGHSQGGHAALFAGQLADTYLPDFPLAGVAALAPATRLQQNLAAVEGTQVGNALTIFAVEAWADYYPDIPDGTLTARAQRPADRIAEICINQPSRFRIVIAGLVLPDTILDIDPTTDPTWTAHLDANSPNPTGITAPVFVAQGLADNVIAPQVTQRWVTDRCARGAPTVWTTYPDVTHPAVIEPGGTDALAWTADRFDEVAPTNQCPS